MRESWHGVTSLYTVSSPGGQGVVGHFTNTTFLDLRAPLTRLPCFLLLRWLIFLPLRPRLAAGGAP